MTTGSGAGEGLSRRGLFGAGLGRALRACAGDGAAARMPAAPVPRRAFRGWTENDSTGLGPRVAPVVEGLLAACDVRAGHRVLVVAAGDGILARAAARTGAEVTAVEPDADLVARGAELCATEGLAMTWEHGASSALPVDDASHDVVLSAFGASHHPDARAVASEMARAARPGAPLALTAWTGLMAAVLDALGGEAKSSRRWARFETAYRHFFDFPDLQVTESTMRWTFADRDAAIAEIGAPARAADAQDRVVAALPALLDRHGEPTAHTFAVAISYAMVFARHP